MFGNRLVGECLEQGTGRIFEKSVLGEYLQGAGRMFENRVQGECLRAVYWENI